MHVEVATQAELDELGPDVIAIVRNGRFVVRGDREIRACNTAEVWAWDSAEVVAYDSAKVWAYGSAKVEAYDSVEVVAWGSAKVWACDSVEVEASGSAEVVAWGSADVTAYGSVKVVAYGSAKVTAFGSAKVTAFGSAKVTAFGSAKVTAFGSAKVTAYNSVKVEAWNSAKVEAYNSVKVTANDDAIVYMMNVPEDWCKFHDIPIVDGKCILFKAVGDDWRGTHKVDNITYRPGDTPVAHDWNDGQICGHGLHLSIMPEMAREHNPDATHYVACEVDVASMVTLGDKVKVPTLRCLYEVTMEGDELP